MKTKKSMMARADEYINHKQGLGFKFEGSAFHVRSYAKYADANFPNMPLTVQSVIQWVKTNRKAKPITKKSFFCSIRGFAEYLKLEDVKTELIPKNIYSIWYKRKLPYIYSEREVMRILAVKPEPQTLPFTDLTYKTITGLLVCTGMRIGEVLALKKNDVDLNKGIITVRQFKKMPKRLIPISNSVVTKLVEYRRIGQKKKLTSKSDAFFLTTKGNAVSYTSFNINWRKTLKKAGITNGKSTPRAHDLRHTFACNHLLRAYKENRDIDDAIYMLSVYLGHTVIQGTYWYLSATPELLEQCVKRVEKPLSPPKREVSHGKK